MTFLTNLGLLWIFRLVFEGQAGRRVFSKYFFNKMQRRTPPSHLIDDFVLLEKANLAASRTLLEQLIACLNFPINAENSKVVAFMSYGSNTTS